MPKVQIDYSLSETAAIFEVSRGTVERWLAAGCPAKRRADRGHRVEWLLCIPDIVAWRRQQAIAKAEAALTGDRGQLKALKVRRLAAETSTLEIEALRRLKSVVDPAYVEQRIGALTDRIRSTLLPIGGILADRIAKMRNPTEIQALIDAATRDALRRAASRDAGNGR